MMAQQEDVRPLSPAAVIPASDVGGEDSMKKENLRRRNQCLIWCCGCVGATVLVLAITSLALFFTVFQAKDPIIVINNVTMGLSLFPPANPMAMTTMKNVSMVVDVSMKNPNAASFKYSNTTTEMYYRGKWIGEARGPPGRARARRTERMNVTVVLDAGQLLSDPGLVQDLGSGIMTMTSYSRITGRMKFLGFVKAHVTVKMNCSMSVNITSHAILGLKCKRNVDF